MPAKRAKKVLGNDIWCSYFKFTVERNPWDLVVSYYYFWMHHNMKMPFDQFIKSGIGKNASNLDLYMDNDTCLVDKVVKYEEFEQELPKISERIGLPENLADVIRTIKAKSHLRKIKDYTSIHTEETREIVTTEFAREIEMFDYSF